MLMKNKVFGIWLIWRRTEAILPLECLTAVHCDPIQQQIVVGGDRGAERNPGQQLVRPREHGEPGENGPVVRVQLIPVVDRRHELIEGVIEPKAIPARTTLQLRVPGPFRTSRIMAPP